MNFIFPKPKLRYFNLDDGTEIYAYDPPDVRNAVIRKFMSSEGYEKWYIELHDLADELDEKQTAWVSIGACDGICLGEHLGKIGIIQRMAELLFSRPPNKTRAYPFRNTDRAECIMEN